MSAKREEHLTLHTKIQVEDTISEKNSKTTQLRHIENQDCEKNSSRSSSRSNSMEIKAKQELNVSFHPERSIFESAFQEDRVMSQIIPTSHQTQNSPSLFTHSTTLPLTVSKKSPNRSLNPPWSSALQNGDLIAQGHKEFDPKKKSDDE